jgi:predicted short-subunit dehydrogenase-like oxidoreductase (DUF2520 family)
MLTIGFIGAGITGTALSVRLAQKDYQVIAVASKSLSSAKRFESRLQGCHSYETVQEVADHVQFVFITTPDDVIATVASNIKWHKGQYVVHCSGAHSTDILEAAQKCGAYTGCFHPLQTFAGIEQAIENIPGSTFAIEAEAPLSNILKEMAAAMNGNCVELQAGDKVLYHTAAVIACNYLVTLVKLATDLWSEFGTSRAQAVKALMPLLQGTLSNIERVGLPDCLTGPIARGDMGTIEKHLRALEEKAPSLLSSYRELGLQTIPIAVAKGKIDTERAEALKVLLNI